MQAIRVFDHYINSEFKNPEFDIISGGDISQRRITHDGIYPCYHGYITYLHAVL